MNSTNRQLIVRGLGVTRSLVGLSALLRPQLANLSLGVDQTTGPDGGTAARMFGIHDAAIAAATLNPDPVCPRDRPAPRTDLRHRRRRLRAARPARRSELGRRAAHRRSRRRLRGRRRRRCHVPTQRLSPEQTNRYTTSSGTCRRPAEGTGRPERIADNLTAARLELNETDLADIEEAVPRSAVAVSATPRH